jgi:tape measure domain-containing protein
MTETVALRLALEGAAQVVAQTERVTGAIGNVEKSALSLSKVAGLSVLGFSAQQAAAAFVRAADAVTTLQTSLRLATGSAASAAQAYGALFDIAQRSRVSFVELGNTFSAISRAGGELGLSQQRLLTVTEAIGNAMTISGGSAQSMQAALVQLGQGLASGTLRGEELNSIMEQTPRLARAIADGLNIPIGKLREMGAAGELTAEQVIEALERSSAALAREVGGATLTFGQSLTQLQNAAIKAAGEIDSTAGITSGLAAEVQALTQFVGEFVAAGNELGVFTTIAETVKLLWSDVKFVFSGVGTEIGIIAAQLAQLAQGNLRAVGEIHRQAVEDSAARRKALDEYQRSVVAPRGGQTTNPADSAGDAAIERRAHEAVATTRARAAVEEKLADIRARLGGATKAAAADSKALADAEAKGIITAKQRAEIESQLAAKRGRSGGAESPYKAAAREIDQTVAALQRRLDTGRELTRAEELEIRLADQLADKADKLRAGERELLLQKNARAVAVQRAIDQATEEARVAEAVARARADLRNAESQGIDDYIAKQEKARQESLESVKERLSSLKDEEAAAGKVRDLNISLAEAVELVAIARLHEAQAKLRDDSKQFADLQREIDARRELLELLGSKASRDAGEKAAQDAADAWKRTVEQTGQSLADALMQGGRSARGYIVGLFRTMTLRPVIQAIVAPVVGTASALLSGGASAASGVSQGAGLLGTIGNVASLFSRGVGASFGSLAASAGKLFGSTALSSFGAGLQGSSLAAGLAGPTTAGASGALGLGSTLAAAAPYVAAAVALFAAKDSLFGRKLKDTSIVGTFGGDAGFSGSTEQFFKGGLFRSNKTTTQALGADLTDPLAAGAKAVRDQVEAYAAALALPTQAVESFTESIRFSVKGLSADQINAKLQEALAGFGSSLAGTLSGDIGPFAKAGEKAGDTLARLATSLGNVNPLLSQLGLDLLGVGAAGGDAASKLVDLFGGFDKLGSSAGQFYQQFYSEQERADQARKALAQTLADVGLAVPATRDAFRDLVEAQDLTTEGGRSAFAALLEVSGAFAELTPASGKLAETLKDAAAIAQERAALEERLLGLQGDTAVLRERERAALDESNRALYDQIAALEAQAAAADAAAQAAAAAAQLAAQVKASVDSIVGDFVGGPELQRYRANRIAEQLGAAGIEATPDGVLGATRDDILALWRAVGDEAKLVVADLYDDWKALQIGIAQGQIDDLLRGLGVTAQDLGAALAEISPPAESLVDAWRRGRAEMQTLATALEDIAGTRAASALDTLRATVEKRDALRGVIGGNAERIFDLRVGQGGQQAVQLLRQREADLWRQFAGTSSPEVAQAITDITLQRIQLEGSLQADANAAQIDALRGQITAAERLRDLAAEMGSFVLSLQAGELSNLSATGRLGAAQQLFDGSLGTGADVQGNAQALLRQAQQTFGGSSATYSAIFEDTLAKLQSVGLGAGEQISDAQRQLDALTRVGDGSEAQIAALGDLNAAFTGQLGMLEGSIGEQTRVLQEQLQAMAEVVANQEAQIVQAGEAYQRMVTALEGIAQGASGSAIDRALAEATP